MANTLTSKLNSNSANLVVLITMVITIAALYFGQEVLIPFALAILISFMLSTPVAWLRRLKVPRVAAVLIVMTLALGIAGSALWVGITQLSDIVAQLPRYKTNVQHKLDAMRNPAGSFLTRGLQSVDQIVQEFSPASPAKPSNAPERTRSSALSPKNSQKPVQAIPVEVVKQKPSMFDSLGTIGMPVARFLAVFASVIILVLFILIEHSDLRNRLFRLFGQGHLNVMTTALDDATVRVSRYLLIQSVINGSFGLLLGLGLFLIGVPNPAFWGVLGALLRFIPYLGTMVAVAGPLALSLAVFDGWERPLMTLALFAALEITMSAAVEPWLCGSHTGLSSLAILISAAFWTLLWGLTGLVLSTPLTVCLLVLGRYVGPLKFIAILLGDEPVLTPQEHFYQRLLAMDDDEAREVAEAFLKDKSLAELYDSVLIPALHLAEQDRHQNALDEMREEFIFQSTKDLVQDLGARITTSSDSSEPPLLTPTGPLVLCVPARDQADELAAVMLAQLLEQKGCNAQAISIGALSDMVDSVEKCRSGLVFISALPPFAVSHARSLCRRIRQRCPDVKIVLGLWDTTVDLDKARSRLGAQCSEPIITTLAQADFQVRLLSGVEAGAPSPAI